MPKRQRSDDWEPIVPSKVSSRTSNPIRKIVDQLKPGKCEKKMIPLSIGDPTIDGNLLPPESAIKAIQEKIATHKFDGYGPSFGYESARKAVAEYHSKNFCPDNTVSFSAKDVILASGASHAIEMTIGALCDEGTNILLPEPCFSLYGTICENRGILTKFYRCDPNNHYEADLDHLRSLVNTRTRAILINNPSNPCGSNFQKSHVEALVKLADELKVPIIADEIYAGMVFGDEVFTSVANIPSKVPRVIIGGIAKNFVVPGWRMGWLILEDPVGVMKEVFAGMVALSTLIVGPNTLIQAALPDILLATPASYQENLKGILQENGKICYNGLTAIPGFQVSKPQAAMYMMVGVDFKMYSDFADDVAFSKALLEEENVVVLPGTVFRAKNYFRIVTAKSTDSLREAMTRIAEFCARHAKS